MWVGVVWLVWFWLEGYKLTMDAEAAPAGAVLFALQSAERPAGIARPGAECGWRRCPVVAVVVGPLVA